MLRKSRRGGVPYCGGDEAIKITGRRPGPDSTRAREHRSIDFVVCGRHAIYAIHLERGKAGSDVGQHLLDGVGSAAGVRIYDMLTGHFVAEKFG